MYGCIDGVLIDTGQIEHQSSRNIAEQADHECKDGVHPHLERRHSRRSGRFCWLVIGQHHLRR